MHLYSAITHDGVGQKLALRGNDTSLTERLLYISMGLNVMHMYFYYLICMFPKYVLNICDIHACNPCMVCLVVYTCAFAISKKQINLIILKHQ